MHIFKERESEEVVVLERKLPTVKKEAQAIPNIRLKALRLKKNWSQVYVATMIGTNNVTVSRWENGTTCPSLYYQQQLCELFGQSPDELGFLPATEEPSQVGGNGVHGGPAIWNVPARRNPFFTGREEVLTHLHALLHSGQTAALTQAQAISGLGGIGKTQTAVEYAYRHRDEYQAVLWCRAETRGVLMADFVTIADLLNLPEKREQDQGRIVQAVKRWLQTHTNWLLILDNMEDLTLVEGFLPTQSEGHLVLTTRTQVTGPFAQRIDLEQMEPEKGALFLLRRAKLIGPEDCLEEVSDALRAEAREVSHLLDGLPLALDQAGAYIEEVGCSLSDYLDHYQTQRVALLNRRGNLIADHPESVSTTFSLSFEKVEQANPAAADLLRLCAFLDPDAIPEEIITEGASDLSSILQPIASNPVALDETLAALRTYSLLQRNAATRTLTIHRLVQAVLKERMDEDTQHWWAERTVCAVNRAFPDGCEFAAWHCCQRCLPHAQACAALIDQWEMAFAEAGRLLNQAGIYLWKHAQYAQAEALLYRARDIYMQVWGSAHPAMAESLNSLAVLYWDQGRYTEAESLLQQALTICEQQVQPEHSDTIQSLNNLALLSFEHGRYTEAESLYRRALTILEQQLELECPHTSQSLNGLAVLSRDANANATQADQLAHSLIGLAELYVEQSRYTQAEPLLRRALAVWEQHLGPQHPHTAFALHDLARVYSAQGRYTEAELLFRRAVEIREQQLGPEHPKTAQSLNNLGKLYTDAGRYTEAEPLLRRALTIREQRLGPEHPYTAFSLNNLAKLCVDVGRYTEAKSLLRRALTIREQKLGPEHPYTVATRENYDDLLLKMKQGKETVPLLSQYDSERD